MSHIPATPAARVPPSNRSGVNTSSFPWPTHQNMTSHVPFLAVRPDDQFSSVIKTSDFASTNSVPPPAMDAADGPEAPHLPSASRLPAFFRFPLAFVLSLSLNTLFYSLIADYAGYELAAISRDITDEWHIGALIGWKFLELSFAWYAGYGWQDLAGLACLSNLPYYFLLYTFYEIDALPCTLALTIDISTLAVPFLLLRQSTHRHEGKDQGQQVAEDSQILLLATIFGSVIYSVVVYSSLYTWLPVYLVTHFDKVRSLEHAHNASIIPLVLVLIPVGWATTQFLFTPAVSARGSPRQTDPSLEPTKVQFNPETATLGETVAANLGYGKDTFSKRAEVLIKRTAVLIVCSVVNTFVRVTVTIDGSDAVGALGWASVWGIAAVLTSTAYAWVGDE